MQNVNKTLPHCIAASLAAADHSVVAQTRSVPEVIFLQAAEFSG